MIRYALTSIDMNRHAFLCVDMHSYALTCVVCGFNLPVRSGVNKSLTFFLSALTLCRQVVVIFSSLYAEAAGDGKSFVSVCVLQSHFKPRIHVKIVIVHP